VAAREELEQDQGGNLRNAGLARGKTALAKLKTLIRRSANFKQMVIAQSSRCMGSRTDCRR